MAQRFVFLPTSFTFSQLLSLPGFLNSTLWYLSPSTAPPISMTMSTNPVRVQSPHTRHKLRFVGIEDAGAHEHRRTVRRPGDGVHPEDQLQSNRGAAQPAEREVVLLDPRLEDGSMPILRKPVSHQQLAQVLERLVTQA